MTLSKNYILFLGAMIAVSLIAGLRSNSRVLGLARGKSRFPSSLYSSSSVAVSANEAILKPIAIHPSFDVVENFFVKEYGLTGTLYKHKKSGAQVLLLK
jgi:hypothetical protein